ncbi:hypothetical protein EXIGLDRAFT_774852 [Exidia glandulosa HHB12029]|uniref:Uncharacterized protein n=1 Tax=Exidia glandulosa HHB12029 TaxID=1314781 RepID=A0A165E6U2_EXIGL|nr:hypothetical protein EXIGLDRAFT_774852 [Exidia glandulosa HHB12029]
MMYTTSTLTLFILLATRAQAHIGAYHKAMYCRNGFSNVEVPAGRFVADPQTGLDWDEFWFRGKCKDFPPPDGEFLELPAGGYATLELAGNKAATSINMGVRNLTEWGDGEEHPELEHRVALNDSLSNCVGEPNLHALDEANASGSALAIAYKSDIHTVEWSDLVVFSVAPNTPWRRVAKFEVPKDMPACPPEGCICAWGWSPDWCARDNLYMNGFRCKVTNARADAPRVAPAQVAKWCEVPSEDGACVAGPKGIIIHSQQDAINNVPTADITSLQKTQRDGRFDVGHFRSPGAFLPPSSFALSSPVFGVTSGVVVLTSGFGGVGYNEKMGFMPGAQNDIFVTTNPNPPTVVVPNGNGAQRPMGQCRANFNLKKRSLEPAPRVRRSRFWGSLFG